MMYAMLWRVSCSSGIGGAMAGMCAVMQTRGASEHRSMSSKTDTEPDTAI